MPHTGFNGPATSLLDNLRHDPRRDEIVDNNRCSLPGSFRSSNLTYRDHRSDGRRRDRFALLIDHKAPVSVAVKSQSKIGVMLTDGSLQIHQICWFNRVSGVIRERAIQLEIQRNNVNW